MTDRELLEAAAKAAGITVLWDHYAGPRDDGAMVTADGYLWNPLTDDGDALRLAVRLQMNVHRYGERVTVDGTVYIAAAGEDGCAATRRAIVRAAAAIGGKE